MRYEFVIDRFDTDKDPSKPLPPLQGKLRLRARSKPHRGRGWRVRTRTGDFGPVHGWRAARVASWKLMHRAGAGGRVIMRSEKTGAIFAVTKVVDEPHVDDLGCAPELERIHAYVWQRGGVRSGGRWYCRYVAGTSTVSRHGYRGPGWLGAAEDIFVLSDSMADLQRLADYIVSLALEGRIHPHAVVVANREWRPGEGWNYYGGEYHRHCHVDVADGYPCRP